MLRLSRRTVVLAVLGLLLLPAVAFAVTPEPTVLLNGKQVWVMLIGAVVPLVTYVLNHFGPQVSEPVKAAVLVVVSAVVGAIYTAIATSTFGFNTPTLDLIVSAVVSALVAHKILWLPSGISVLLGGGANANAHGKVRAVRSHTKG